MAVKQEVGQPEHSCEQASRALTFERRRLDITLLESLQQSTLSKQQHLKLLLNPLITNT